MCICAFMRVRAFMCVFLLVKVKNAKAINRKKTTKDALSKASANHDHIIRFIHVYLDTITMLNEKKKTNFKNV